jgi:hypothetical protein
VDTEEWISSNRDGMGRWYNPPICHANALVRGQKILANQLKRQFDELRTLRQPSGAEGWTGSYDIQPVSYVLLSGYARRPFAFDLINSIVQVRVHETEDGRASRIWTGDTGHATTSRHVHPFGSHVSQHPRQ